MKKVIFGIIIILCWMGTILYFTMKESNKNYQTQIDELSSRVEILEKISCQKDTIIININQLKN